MFRSGVVAGTAKVKVLAESARRLRSIPPPGSSEAQAELREFAALASKEHGS